MLWNLHLKVFYFWNFHFRILNRRKVELPSVTSSPCAVTFSMMSSRLLKWCVLQPSARSTNSCVACFLTDKSRSSAIWPSWGITTTSISSSWSKRAQGFKHYVTTTRISRHICVQLRTDFIELSICAEHEGQDVQNLDPDHSTALVPDKEREKCYLWGFVDELL